MVSSSARVGGDDTASIDAPEGSEPVDDRVVRDAGERAVKGVRDAVERAVEGVVNAVERAVDDVVSTPPRERFDCAAPILSDEENDVFKCFRAVRILPSAVGGGGFADMRS